MEFWDGSIDYTVDLSVPQNKTLHKKEAESKEGHMFKIIDDVDSLDHLPGKAVGNGVMKFSQSKNWSKTIDKIEIEQTNQDQLLLSLNNIEETLIKLEERLIKIYNLISNQETSTPWWKKFLK